jgi:hypothetical protein
MSENVNVWADGYGAWPTYCIDPEMTRELLGEN